MRSKLLYLFSGVLLTSVVLLGAGLLRGQGATAGPRWEYAWVDVKGPGTMSSLVSSDQQLVSVAVNNKPMTFSGTVVELFNQLGAEGWEHIGDQTVFHVFKRPLP